MFRRWCFASVWPVFTSTLPWTSLRGHLGQREVMATHIQLPASMVEEQQFPGIQPPWTTDSVWRDTVGSLVNFPPGLSVIDLCAGAGTASIFLKLLLGQDKAVLAGAWDISPDLAPIFRTVHGNLDNKVHLGLSRGGHHGDQPGQLPMRKHCGWRATLSTLLLMWTAVGHAGFTGTPL